jgi:hypothetical protein
VTLVLSDDDVQQAFNWGLAIDGLRAAYAGAAEPGRYPNRTVARGGVNWFRALSGVPADGSPIGLKGHRWRFRATTGVLHDLPLRPGHGRTGGLDGR